VFGQDEFDLEAVQKGGAAPGVPGPRQISKPVTAPLGRSPREVDRCSISFGVAGICQRTLSH
jgi:hypothetical protein